MNMNRLYFSILIILPHTVNAFFRVSPSNINVTRNITCRLAGNETSESNFQLCAIRIYQGTTDASVPTFSLYDGFRYGNTLRRYIQKWCGNQNNTLPANTGLWSCATSLPFEISLKSIQLCVCATSNCNIDMNSCQQSVILNTNISQLLDIMPNLNLTLQCSDTLNENNTCGENPYIDVGLCQDYVRSNSVLCAITLNGTEIIQTSLIYENYEAYLDEKIYEITSALSMTPNNFSIESNNDFFYNYSNIGTGSIEECACTSYSFCNENITTCASLNTSQLETTMPTTSFATDYSSTLIDTSTDTLITDMSAESTTATPSTDVIMTTLSPIITPPPVIVPSATTQSSSTGDTGLGSAATAGIACGIIFSAVIFTAEIIFFKFFYSGHMASGFDRSVRYQA